jgi:hypothetical protein
LSVGSIGCFGERYVSRKASLSWRPATAPSHRTLRSEADKSFSRTGLLDHRQKARAAACWTYLFNTSDFIGFIMLAAPANTAGAIDLFFYNYAINCGGVTLLLKVKPNFILHGVRLIGNVPACRTTTTMYWMPMASAS